MKAPRLDRIVPIPRTPGNPMRIALLLVLLLAASARPASAQYAHLEPAQQALPASLTPPVTTGPLVVQLERDHWKGAQIGSVVGAVAGALVATLHSCPDYADGASYCKLAGIGLGALAGAVVGGLIGVPDRPTR